MRFTASSVVLSLAVLLTTANARNTARNSTQCRKTKVAVLGAGMSGIIAAQALSNASVEDFLIVEYNDYIGGRMAHTTFGRNPSTRKPYVIEKGCNWVQGLQAGPGDPENPIWRLAQKWGINNTYSDYSSILTYNDSGYADYSDLLDEYEEYYSIAEEDAGTILTQNLQDRSMRTGLSVAGWKPKKNMNMQAVDWWEFDWEYAFSPEESSQEYAVVNYNTTFYQYSDANNFVIDQRGFNYLLEGEASEFLAKNDSRLLFNHVVSKITNSKDSVTITMSDGSCIVADYAITTFSLGVLQNDVVEFSPALPDWKQLAIETMEMGTYTKIFLQFEMQFWDDDTQFFLYADPDTRGYYPVWQSLSTEGFFPGSNIIFVTVVDDQSYIAESQSNAQTQAQVMQVLRTMFPHKVIPEPVAFYYPRWSTTPWAYGSYSNWPVGMTIDMHQNLRANVGRLWFAGEALSAEYFGFLQGAYFEGQNAGEKVAACVNTRICPGEPHYNTLHGSQPITDYSPANGWTVSSFETYGDE